MEVRKYDKHFIPLESSPEVFNQLIHDLGVSPDLKFEDVITLDDPGFLPRPALALVLVFPASETYDARKNDEELGQEEYNEGNELGVAWFQQTIHNACGLYAILHAIYNCEAKNFIRESDLPLHWKCRC
jgi:ubiquitin carboxyl-terminal hydrolase L3